VLLRGLVRLLILQDVPLLTVLALDPRESRVSVPSDFFRCERLRVLRSDVLVQSCVVTEESIRATRAFLRDLVLRANAKSFSLWSLLLSLLLSSSLLLSM